MRPLAVSVICAGVLATQAFGGLLQFTGVMSGANEVPPTGSPATGLTLAIVDTVANTLFVNVSFSGLIGGPATAAHIHCCALAGTNAMVAVPYTGFPAATSGTYSHTFDLLDTAVYTAGFLTLGGGTAAGAESLLIANMQAGRTYSNIHDAQFPGGEIRAQLVPEPATLALAAAGLLLLGAMRRRRA